MDHIRVWTVTEPRMVSVVARCEDRWIRVSTSVGGRIGYATVTAPEFAQPVLDAVAMVAGRAV